VRERRDFLAWARERAIHVDLLGGPDPTVLTALDPLLDGKRIVYLGEANHFIHEKYAYRELFLRHLVARGFRFVGEELAWTDGVWIQRYLESGDEACLDRVAAYGYHGAPRNDRDDAPKGILGRLVEKQPEAALGFEQRRFDATLRAISEDLPVGEKLHFFGFDVDYVPSAGYEVFEPWLDAAAGAEDGAVATLRQCVARVPGETKLEESERLESAVAEIDARREELVAALGGDRVRALRRSVRTTSVAHRYGALADEAGDYPALGPAMALREELMVEHVREVLSSLADGDRLVLMSHDHHLARDDDGILEPGGGVGPGGGRAPSVGCAIARAHPEDVFVVWMLEAEGRDASPLPGWDGRVRCPRGSLNRWLAQVGDAFALPIRTDDPRARLLRRALPYTTMNGARMRAVLPDQADVLFFVRRVTPLQRA
jgi:erythromycin esterase-like protein